MSNRSLSNTRAYRAASQAATASPSQRALHHQHLQQNIQDAVFRAKQAALEKAQHQQEVNDSLRTSTSQSSSGGHQSTDNSTHCSSPVSQNGEDSSSPPEVFRQPNRAAMNDQRPAEPNDPTWLASIRSLNRAKTGEIIRPSNVALIQRLEQASREQREHFEKKLRRNASNSSSVSNASNSSGVGGGRMNARPIFQRQVSAGNHSRSSDRSVGTGPIPGSGFCRQDSNISVRSFASEGGSHAHTPDPSMGPVGIVGGMKNLSLQGGAPDAPMSPILDAEVEYAPGPRRVTPPAAAAAAARLASQRQAKMALVAQQQQLMRETSLRRVPPPPEQQQRYPRSASLPPAGSIFEDPDIEESTPNSLTPQMLRQGVSVSQVQQQLHQKKLLLQKQLLQKQQLQKQLLIQQKFRQQQQQQQDHHHHQQQDQQQYGSPSQPHYQQGGMGLDGGGIRAPPHGFFDRGVGPGQRDPVNALNGLCPQEQRDVIMSGRNLSPDMPPSSRGPLLNEGQLQSHQRDQLMQIQLQRERELAVGAGGNGGNTPPSQHGPNAAGPGPVRFSPTGPSPMYGIPVTHSQHPYHPIQQAPSTYFHQYPPHMRPIPPPPLPPSVSIPATPVEKMIEIAPNQWLRLRGADETWAAIEHDFYAPAYCYGCMLELCCIRDADCILCPACRVVSPVRVTDSATAMSNGGVGLGFTFDDLRKWQSEIAAARQRQNRYQYGVYAA